MRLQVEIPIVRSKNEDGSSRGLRLRFDIPIYVWQDWGERERAEEAGVSEPLARMPVVCGQNPFIPYRDSCGIPSFVIIACSARPKQKRSKAEGRKEEEERDGKQPCGMRGAGEGERKRERESRTSPLGGTGLPRYSPGEEL